jgi:hypothetical protein
MNPHLGTLRIAVKASSRESISARIVERQRATSKSENRKALLASRLDRLGELLEEDEAVALYWAQVCPVPAFGAAAP